MHVDYDESLKIVWICGDDPNKTGKYLSFGYTMKGFFAKS